MMEGGGDFSFLTDLLLLLFLLRLLMLLYLVLLVLFFLAELVCLKGELLLLLSFLILDDSVSESKTDDLFLGKMGCFFFKFLPETLPFKLDLGV